MAFPTTIVTYTTKQDNVDYPEAAHINDLQTVVEALETKVGIDGSAIATTLDYKLKNTTAGHDHDGSNSKKVDHIDLDNKGTNTHLQIDTALSTLPVKASGAEVNTGTDDAKFVTSKAIEDSELSFISDTETLTNKRITKRVVSAASYTTDTGTSLDVSTADVFIITAQAGALKFNNPGGTPTQGQTLVIRIKDNATARALTYDTQFRALGTSLPTTTVLSKTLYLGFIFNSTDTKWDCIAAAQEA